MYRKIEGCLVTVPTFFLEDGRLNEERFYKHVRHLVRDGVNAIKLAGLTGECTSLSLEEHMHVLNIGRVAISEVCGDDVSMPVVASINSNEIKMAGELASVAYSFGYKWLDSTLPYFSQPTFGGIIKHFEALRQAAPEATIIMHHAPRRTGGRQLSVEEIIKLHEMGLIDGVMWTFEGYIDTIWQLVQLGQYSRDNGHKFVIIGGDDYHLTNYYAAGCTACQGVIANVLLDKVMAVHSDLRHGHIACALNRLHFFFPLLAQMKRLEDGGFPNPVPIKMLMNLVWPEKYQAIFRNSLTLPPEESQAEFVSLVKQMNLQAEEVSYDFASRE